MITTHRTTGRRCDLVHGASHEDAAGIHKKVNYMGIRGGHHE